MSWPKFFGGFILVVAATYGKSQVTDYWVPIEFSFFLIFFIIRSTKDVRCLAMTFILSLSLDLLLQIGQIKGLGAVGQLLLVYLILKLKRSVVPNFQDFFLLGIFAIFYITNYIISMGLSSLLGNYYPEVSFVQLLFLALFHTGFFGILLLISRRFAPRGED